MSKFYDADAEAVDFVNMNNELINENINYRRMWEEDAKLVYYASHGNKYPVQLEYTNRTLNDSRVRREKGTEVFVNLIKRQYRVMANYLNNNEPMYVITGASAETQQSDEVSTREFLDFIFQGQSPKLYWEDDVTFYDTTMDEVIYYGLFRWITWTLAYYTEEEGYCFRSYDPLDTYIDTSARQLSKVRKFLNTYTKTKEELRVEFPTDAFGDIIDWDTVSTDQDQTMSEVKKCFLPEPENPTTLLLREGYYLENVPDTPKERVVYRVLTTNSLCLKKEKLEWLKFLPLTWFAPMGEPETLYPRGWYTDMLPLEREINRLILKINNIIKTGGRFVYIKAGTVLHKATSALMNSLNIEVIEVTWNQELPNQAQLLTVSQADLEWLNWLMAQADDEGGMQQDIMWASSTGPDASWKAIQALQAGSKNNIGTALNELNKYMSRLVRIVLRLHDVYGDADGTEFYSKKENGQITMKKETAKRVKVKVSITGADAFDDITQQAQAIQILDIIQKFNPNIEIPPHIITRIMDTTNEIADQIQDELDKQADPDLQIAEGENKKFVNGDTMNANINDNHEVHKAMHTEMLKSIPPESPVAKILMGHIRMHDAFIQADAANSGWAPQ